MKKLPIMFLSSLLVMGGLVGCGETPASSDSTPGSSQGTSQATLINGVSIIDPGITEIYGGQSLSLKAVVDGPAGSKVKWSSSNEDVATVRNGTVRFKTVSEDTQVTITATSSDDSTKKAEVTFTVKYCVIDLENSKGSFDATLFDEEGITVETGDSGLVYKDVYDTKWYVEATINLLEFDENDPYPKFGIMTGNSANADWNATFEDNICKNAFYFMDAQKNVQQTGINWLGFVGQNDEYNNWDWTPYTSFNLATEDKIKVDEEFKIGLLRSGVDYFLYASQGDQIKAYRHAVWNEIPATEPSYAWIGGWATGYIAKNFRSFVGDEVDALFQTPTSLTLSSTEQVLFINDTYQINFDLGVVDYNPELLSFTSADPTVATVDERGLVVAGENDGETTITVTYGELEATLNLVVTSDTKYNVVLDGEMTDAIWTEQVKTNKYVARNDNLSKVEVYASRNSRGLYIFADYDSVTDATAKTNWWEGNNFEMTFTSANGLLINAFELSIGASVDNRVQFWTSNHAGTNQHNYTDGYLSPLVLNEETQRYEMTFEMFISYEYLVQPDTVTTVTKNDAIGFGFGTPTNGNFVSTSGYRNGNIVRCPKITETGIYDGLIPESECSSHIYGEYSVTIPATCSTDGEEEATCKTCGHVDKKVITATGDHNWNLEAVTVTTPATCTTKGVGSAPCYGTCGVTKDDVELPLDAHNHSSYDDTLGKCTACGNSLKEAYTIDRFDVGGWDNNNAYPRNGTWYYLAENLSGDFEVTVKFNHLANNANLSAWGDYCWRSVLPIVQDATAVENGDGSIWVTRLDWYGWTNPCESTTNIGTFENTTEYRKEWYPGSDVIFKSLLTNSEMELTFKRTGTTIRYDLTMKNSEGEFTYWAQLLNVDETKPINLAFAAEYTKLIIDGIYVK